MMMFGFVVLLAIALSAAMALAWIVALWSGRSGWIDAIWSFAVGAGGVAGSLVDFEAVSARQWLVACLVAIWSLRLGVHIARRTMTGGDDPRYAQLRKEWGEKYRRKLFWFLQIQAAVALLLALSVTIAAHRSEPGLDLADIFGVFVLVIAVLGEGAADRQLERFKHDPKSKGKVCDIGLWRWSRHPNYFFEWLGWLAYVFIAVDPTGGYPFGWLTLAGPVVMYWLLVHVSGIPPLEAHMMRSRGDAFRAHQQRVNAFWPAPKKAIATEKRRVS